MGGSFYSLPFSGLGLGNSPPALDNAIMMALDGWVQEFLERVHE